MVAKLLLCRRGCQGCCHSGATFCIENLQRPHVQQGFAVPRNVPTVFRDTRFPAVVSRIFAQLVVSFQVSNVCLHFLIQLRRKRWDGTAAAAPPIWKVSKSIVRTPNIAAWYYVHYLPYTMFIRSSLHELHWLPPQIRRSRIRTAQPRMVAEPRRSPRILCEYRNGGIRDLDRRA